MNIILLFIFVNLGLFLLILHSYYLRGKRITFNFFFFAFLLSFMKEVHSPRSNLVYPIPYEFLSPKTPFILSQLTVTLGWVFTFYLSWCIAEQVLRRAVYFRNRIFMTLLLSGLVVGSISYCLEATGITIGWWHWNLIRTRQFEDFLVNCPAIAIKAWTYFSLHFLAAFLLIECSKYRNTSWKMLFFLIPLIHIWFIRFLGGKVSLEFEGSGMFALLLVLAFTSRLSFERGSGENGIRRKDTTFQKYILPNAPLIVTAYMLLILVVIDIAILKQAVLLISLLPIVFLVLLAIRKIPFFVVALFSLLSVCFIGRKSVPGLIPVSLVFLIQAIPWLQKVFIKPEARN